MDPAVYDIETQVEATHWWFVGRRRLFQRLLLAMKLPAGARVLDLGCGTGPNLALLQEMDLPQSLVLGLDLSQSALAHCGSKGLGPLVRASATTLPFGAGSFDLVLMTDILEHVADGEALTEAQRVLKPGGLLLLAVPAFPSLWGLQDDVSHHLRRYRLEPLRRLLRQHGFTVQQAFYFNYLLFFPIWLARQVIRLLRVPLKSENQVNTPGLNRLLTRLFGLDVATAPRLHPPFGVSALVVGVKGTAPFLPAKKQLGNKSQSFPKSLP